MPSSGELTAVKAVQLAMLISGATLTVNKPLKTKRELRIGSVQPLKSDLLAATAVFSQRRMPELYARGYHQAHNLKVRGSNPLPATTFTERRYGSFMTLSASAESVTMFAISPTRSMARPSSAGRTSMRAMSGCRLPERSRERFVDEVYGRIVRLL